MLDYILRRKRELNAVILAHYYQIAEIQDLADFVGDSLQLAQQAARTDARVIISCGVSFMAETAKILSPDKMVLIPEKEAGCPMADMVSAEALREKKKQHPGAVVVSYVNTSAEVKAESDICCTSSNAVAVVESIPADREIIFVPDRNLAQYVAARTGRNLILWEGCCPVHDVLTREAVEEQLALHPQARLVVHPECPPEVTARADAVRSTFGILEYIKNSADQEFIIGTEEGFLHTLQKNCPGKRFYLARADFRCADMKKITLSSLAHSMTDLKHQVEVPPAVSQKAYQALQRMLKLQ